MRYNYSVREKSSHAGAEGSKEAVAPNAMKIQGWSIRAFLSGTLLMSIVTSGFYDKETNSQQLIGNGTFPLRMSSVNAGDLSTYTFRFSLQSSIVDPCFLQLSFPPQSYISGMGMSFVPLISIKVQNQLLDQVKPPSVQDTIITLYPRQLPSNQELTLTVENVKNSYKIGGLGLFELKTMCGSQVVSINRNFANVGLSLQKEVMNQARVEIDEASSKRAGDLSNYLFIINPKNDVSALAIFRFEFPAIYDLSNLSQIAEDYPSSNMCSVSVDQNSAPLLSSRFTCIFSETDNSVEFHGLSESSFISHSEEHDDHLQHQLSSQSSSFCEDRVLQGKHKTAEL
jgi:hypothetical protein